MVPKFVTARTQKSPAQGPRRDARDLRTGGPMAIKIGLAGPLGERVDGGLDRIRIDRTHFWGSIDPVNPV